MSVLINGIEKAKSYDECQLKRQGCCAGTWFCCALATDNSDCDISKDGKPFNFVPEYCPVTEVSDNMETLKGMINNMYEEGFRTPDFIKVILEVLNERGKNR